MRHLQSPHLVYALTCLVVAALAAVEAHAQEGYASHAELGRRLETAVSGSRGRASLSTIGKTRGGRELWAVAIGSGEDRERRPAVLIVGGIDAGLVGREIALRFVERLAADQSDSVAQLLRRATFYVIPSINPDGSERAFGPGRHEGTYNATPYDDDRDGEIDEDPVVDLNGDGVISTMRVRSPSGTWMVDPKDPRLIRKADAAHGDVGVFQVFAEGRDADRDGAVAEDRVGGVDLNRNFPFDYRAFTSGAGAHAVSEAESRALADFCYDHQNIVAVFAFAPQANLLEPWKPVAPGARNHGAASRGVRAGDETVMNRIATLYRDITGLRGGPAPPESGGSFLEWAYYHYGRPAFGTPGWWLSAPEKRDSAAGAAEGLRNAVADTLAWLEAIGVRDAWINWRKVDHPELGGREVEIGGLRPGATTVPPSRMLDSLAALHARFLVALAGLMPRLEIGEMRAEPLGRGVRRVRATLVNRGFLPTLTTMGDMSQVPVDAKAELDLAGGQHLAAGRRIQIIGSIPGSGGSRELTWLVVGDGSVTLSVAGPMVGSVRERIELR